MTYEKPEVTNLGTAVNVVEQVPSQKASASLDGALTRINPAYDLDE
jgi:hypothetical protein